MPKILITGNGFDLNLGLPTSYNDFIKILNYIEGNSDFDFENVYSNCQDFESLKNKYKAFSLKVDKIEELKQNLSENIWFKFFKKEKELETWIDFENKIEYVLKNLFISINQIRSNIFKDNSLINSDRLYDFTIFNKKIEPIEVSKVFGIISSPRIGKIQLSEKFLTKKYGEYIDLDLDKISKFIYQELIQFKKILNLYFEIFIIPFYDNRIDCINNRTYKNINYHYTFNYTPTFERFYETTVRTQYLHGKINPSDNKIVLGINDVPENENINKEYFFPFTKYYQKLYKETDYVFLNEFKNNPSEEFQFFFIGHSLNKSDEDYINEVFEFAKKINSIKNKIIITYHNNDSKAQLLNNLFSIRGKNNILDLKRNNELLLVEINSNLMHQELDSTLRNSFAVF